MSMTKTKIPILFSAPMILAILAGKKTMTRRVIPELSQTDMPSAVAWALDHCRYGSAGDRLWVRENFWIAEKEGGGIGVPFVFYSADQDGGHVLHGQTCEVPVDAHCGKWGQHPSIHMPRWASRITLEVVSVRVERLQEITEEDAKREGVWGENEPYQGVGDLPTDRFRHLWDSINGERGYSWQSNPWVWCVEFRRIKP